METVDALRARPPHTAHGNSQIPSTGRAGSARPGSAVEPLFRRSADRSGTRAGAAGTRAGRPSFSAPSWPPGAPSRRLGSGRARLGLCRDPEPGARCPALRPLGTGPPASAPCCGPHAARAHTMPARGVRSAPLRPLALSVSGARSFPSPCSEEGAREGVRRPDGSGRRDRSRSA